MAVSPTTAAALAHRIWNLQRALRSARVATATQDGLPLALEGVLRMVGAAGTVRASEIAGQMGVGAPVLSRQIAELEQEQLIVRRPDPADGRAYLLSLSLAGEQYFGVLEQRRIETMQETLASWDDDRAQDALRALDDLTTTLDGMTKTIRAARIANMSLLQSR